MRCSLESKALLVFFWVILKIFWVNWRLNWQSLALIWSQNWHSRGQRDWSATLLNLSDQGHDRVPGIWMESEFGLNPLMVYWWMTKFESAKYRTFVDTYIWLMNIEHCAQSVRNVRVCCLVVRTRVCQMFPFTRYNPLGHTQSQRMFIFQYSVSHHYQMFLSTIYNPLGHPQSQKNVQSLIITTNNPIGHTQSQRMFSLSSLAGLTSPIQSSFCSCFHFPVTKK